VNAFKYVVQEGNIDAETGLPTKTLGNEFGVYVPSDEWMRDKGIGSIYVQPLDEQDEEKNKRNLKAAMDTCYKHGYRLGLQSHKELGLE